MRLFVAFDLPAEVRQALGELIAQLCPLCPKARWVRSQSMHLTLKFLGHVDDQAEAQLAAIRSALAAVHSPAPVEMQFRGVGFFPDARRPRVVWCGIDSSPNIVPLAADISRALEPLGFPPEDRPFVPHLTLARLDAARRRQARPRRRATDGALLRIGPRIRISSFPKHPPAFRGRI